MRVTNYWHRVPGEILESSLAMIPGNQLQVSVLEQWGVGPTEVPCSLSHHVVIQTL